MIADRYTRTMTVRHVSAGAVDEYGDPTDAEASAEVIGHYRQTSADERAEDTTLAGWRLYFPAGTTIASADIVDLDNGLSVEVIGPPNALYDPRRRTITAVVCAAEVTA